MFKLISSFHSGREWLRARLAASLAAILSTLLLSGCTFFVHFGPDARQDVLKTAKKRGSRSAEAVVSGIRIRVTHAEGEEQAAREALAEAERAASFLSRRLGTAESATVNFYLYPLQPDEPAPNYTGAAKGDYFAVLFHRRGESLLSVYENREALRSTFPHELAHALLSSWRLSDRWLGEGLPEYLAAEFARLSDPEFYDGLHWWRPPVVALKQTELTAWGLGDFRRMMVKTITDRAYADALGDEMIWKYAAAEELVRRWLQAASENGIADPIRDLGARIKRLDRRVDWETTRRLCVEQTGRPVEQIAAVTKDQERLARQRSWDLRSSANLRARSRSLRTLGFLGLPEGASSDDLLASFQGPTKTEWGPTVWTAAAEAVAAGNSPETALAAVQILKDLRGKDYIFSAVPEIWSVIARVDRDLALIELVKMVTAADTLDLPLRDRANAVLERLTGRRMGWSIRNRKGREKAADRWQSFLRGSALVPEPASGPDARQAQRGVSAATRGTTKVPSRCRWVANHA